METIDLSCAFTTTSQRGKPPYRHPRTAQCGVHSTCGDSPLPQCNRNIAAESAMNSPDASATESAVFAAALTRNRKLPPKCSKSKTPTKSHRHNRQHAAVSSAVWKRNKQRAWEYGRRMLSVKPTGASGEASTANRRKHFSTVSVNENAFSSNVRPNVASEQRHETLKSV